MLKRTWLDVQNKTYMKKSPHIINIIIAIIFSVIAYTTDEMINTTMHSPVLLITGLISFLIFLYSLENIFLSIKNKSGRLLFCSIGYVLGFLSFEIIAKILQGNFVHFFIDTTEGTFFGIFLLPFNYLYSIPAATIGLAIDGAIYLYKKHRR